MKHAAVESQNGAGSGGSPIPSEAPPGGSGHSPSKTILSQKGLGVCAVLAAAILAVYAPSLEYGFIGFDDPEYVTRNPRVLGGLTWESVRWAFSTGYFSNWHPLTWLSYMLDIELSGANAGGLRLTNVLLHIANTLLLLGLLHRMTGKLGRSAFVAALFAVHPLHVESVAWISERKDVLSTLFGLLALWAYVGYARRPQVGRYLLVVLFFGMSLMSKSMLVTLPFVLLLLDVWPLGRIQIPTDSSGRLEWTPALRNDAWRLVREKLPLLALTIASCIVTFVVQQPGRLNAIPLDFRLANMAVSYVGYIAKMLWPAGLSIFYPYPDTLPGWQVFGSAFVLIAVSVVVMREAPRKPYLAVGWLWYLGTLAPVIGLVQVGSQAMADRYTYVPLIGIFLLVAWAVPDLLARWPYRRTVLPGAAVVAICACAVVARGQVRLWENDDLLWRRSLAGTTGNYLAHNNLGTALADEGRFVEAMAQYEEALRIRPDYADAHNNLGTSLAAQGRIREAISHYEEAIRFNPEFAEARYNLGVALDEQGRSEEAVAQYQEALRLDSDYADAHNNLAAFYLQQGRMDEAITHYREAVRLRPGSADAHFNLGIALANRGNTAEARMHLTEALRLNPANERLRNLVEQMRPSAEGAGQSVNPP